MPRELSQGDSWFQTKDTGLAAVLTSLDFGFFDPDQACEYQETGGKKTITWMYESFNKDKTLSAMDVLKHWKNAEKYCEDNPACRVASAIATAKNLRVFNSEIKKMTPMTCYEVGSNKYWVKKGTDKEIKLSKSSRAKKI